MFDYSTTKRVYKYNDTFSEKLWSRWFQRHHLRHHHSPLLRGNQTLNIGPGGYDILRNLRYVASLATSPRSEHQVYSQPSRLTNRTLPPTQALRGTFPALPTSGSPCWRPKTGPGGTPKRWTSTWMRKPFPSTPGMLKDKAVPFCTEPTHSYLAKVSKFLLTRL